MKQRGKFVVVKKGLIVEVWIPPVDHPEGDRLVSLHVSLVPMLLAALKEAQEK